MMTLYSQSNCRSKPVILGHDVCYFKQFIRTEKDISGLNRVHHNITICHMHACAHRIKYLKSFIPFLSSLLLVSASLQAFQLIAWAHWEVQESGEWKVFVFDILMSMYKRNLYIHQHIDRTTHMHTLALSLSLSNTILFLTLNSYIYTFLFAQQH